MGRDVLFKKSDILRAAFLIFKQEGIDKFTIRNIATVLGASTSPIYYHFKSLEEVQDAMVEEIVELFIHPIKGYEDYYTYENLTIAFAIFSKRHQKLFKAIFLTSSSKLGNPIREKVYTSLKRVLEKDEVFDCERDKAELLFSDGLALQFYNSHLEYKDEDIEKQVRHFLNLKRK